MGLFKKKSTDPAEMEQLKAEIAAMAARLDQTDADKAELHSWVNGLTTKVDAPLAAPLAPPVVVKPAITEADLDMLRARLQRLSDRLDQVDARITSISTELANQITELSGDVEALHEENREGSPAISPAVAAVDEELVGEIRDAQVRLASEQARYQIAFRQDLAELAERLKRA